MQTSFAPLQAITSSMSHLPLMLFILSIYFLSIYGFGYTNFNIKSKKTFDYNTKISPLFATTSVDDEEIDYISQVKSTYLTNKFKDCRKVEGEEVCRSLCTLSEVEMLLRSILPPVTADELSNEIKVVLSKIPSESVKSDAIDVNDFLDAVRTISLFHKSIHFY